MESPQTRLCPSPPPAVAEPWPSSGQRCPGGEHTLDQKSYPRLTPKPPWRQEVATGWACSYPGGHWLLSCSPHGLHCRPWARKWLPSPPRVRTFPEAVRSIFTPWGKLSEGQSDSKGKVSGWRPTSCQATSATFFTPLTTGQELEQGRVEGWGPGTLRSAPYRRGDPGERGLELGWQLMEGERQSLPWGQNGCLRVFVQ